MTISSTLILYLLLIPLGSPNYHTREKAHFHFQRILNQTDQIQFVQKVAQQHPDPEVRRRMQLSIRRYYNVLPRNPQFKILFDSGLYNKEIQMARDLMYDLNLYPDENGNSGSLYSLHFPQCFAAALFKMGYNRTKIVKLLRGQ